MMRIASACAPAPGSIALPGAHSPRARLLLRAGVCCLIAAAPLNAALAQTAHFSQPNDTIHILAADTVLGGNFTFEAMVLREASGGPGGRLFAEQSDSQEDKALVVNPLRTYGSVWNGGDCLGSNAGDFANPIPVGVWKHIAFVRSGATFYFFIDGALVDSQPTGCLGRDAAGSFMSIGAFPYFANNNYIDDSFIGYVDWLRVSWTSRYTAPFTPPACEPANDIGTLLLLLFDEAPNTTILTDSGPYAHTGLVGAGFSGASAPTFGPAPVSQLVLTSQPVAAAACASGGATFSVAVQGSGPFNYQWQVLAGSNPGWRDVVEGVNSVDGHPRFTAAGARAAVLVMDHSADFEVWNQPSYSFQCTIVSDCHAVVSNPATLTVCRADFNCDHAVNIPDIFSMLAAWFAAAPGTDFNLSGGTDIGDIFAFLAIWFAGC